MREKELRLALVCYGGISLAVYMHGITKEIWHLLRASRDFHSNEPPCGPSEHVYREMLNGFQANGLRLRVLSDIIAGASAGGINGVFLGHAIATGQSLDPLTDLWLVEADVERLLDPDARPISRFTKFWAAPIAWWFMGKRGSTIEQTVAVAAREEVRGKLSQFVRARWFEPPFGGAVFSNMLLDAFDAMARAAKGPKLLPPSQPLDLFVTVTDFHGHEERLRLNSPAEIEENEHRLTIGFRSDSAGTLGEPPSLVFAARATASFPGAFPPFTVGELDRLLERRRQAWGERASFLDQLLPKGRSKSPEELVLIDGSVLSNAPFRPAIEALRERPAKREVDRRFVYIDPKPGIRSVSITRKGEAALPGFFNTIFGAMSDIPREQPIRDNLDAIAGRSARIRRMQRIIDAVQPDVEASIQKLFGMTFFLDKPTPARLNAWRDKAQDRAAKESGHSYSAYAHVKLSGIVEELVSLVARIDPEMHGPSFDAMRQSLWQEVRRRGADRVSKGAGQGATAEAITFFQQHDIRFRIRRLRFLARTIAHLIDSGQADPPRNAMQDVIYARLAAYLERESARYFRPLDRKSAAALLDDITLQRGLGVLDADTDIGIANALSALPKDERRTVLLAYLGFPYYDIGTLPMLQGEGLDEFDPIKVDRIAPDDARGIREGGARATLKGIELNSFGAFFSRAYRENDYLWGRLHGAERLIDIIYSTLPESSAPGVQAIATTKLSAFLAILDEEQPRLKRIPELFATLRREIETGPLAKEAEPG